jgi:oligopeptide transport system ATP-binding protein
MQLVFQDPYSSLNPRKRVGQSLRPILRMRGLTPDEAETFIRKILPDVGLSYEDINRYPHEFSGGQRQRIGIARALCVAPSVLLLDEPVSALDMSIQAQVLNMLADIQDEFSLSYILVAHDLAVVQSAADRIAVMYLGKIVELASCAELLDQALHPYTQSLFDSVPIPDPHLNRERARHIPSGEPPNPASPPNGCRFHTRCPRATSLCASVDPTLVDMGQSHWVACHHPLRTAQSESPRS